MRHLLLILVLCLSKLVAQVGPPSLRCLQVAGNGDVTLSWVPPADPTNAFTAYEIWCNPLNSTSPFSLITTLPGSIFTNTYTHVGAGADVQARYYYIVTKYGPGGSSSSVHSDTLKTIFVNVLPVPAALKISYNTIHLPQLATSSNSFNILKEYPAGTWAPLGSTSGLNYPDTLSVCQASINYQVTLLDASGCISTSNIQGGLYSDTKDPNQPFVDSISVLPNGTTIIAWRIPRDMDIVQYRIYQILGGATITIDTVNGRNTTSYIFSTTTALIDTVGLTLAAIDSCNRISPFDPQPRTMFLIPRYNRCDYKTELSWNAYPNMPNGVKEYRIYYSVNGGPFSLVGVTTDTKFTHSNVAPNKTIQYYIRAFNKGLTISSSSNRATFFSTEVQAPSFVYMRTASVNGKNSAMVQLFLDTSQYCRGIDIYRSEDGIDFKPAGFVPVNKKPDYTYTDLNISPDQTSYYYRAIIKDSCGNARTLSNVSKTILLKVKEDDNLAFTKHLSWSDYEGFDGGTSGYNVYRVLNGEAEPNPIGSTGIFNRTYTDDLQDEAPNGSKIDYMVEAVEGINNAYGFKESSLSNTRPVYMEGQIFVPSAFAPNGANKKWRPVTHFIDKQEYRVRVFNRWGNKIFETGDDTEGWGGDGSEAGIYCYLISYKNSRGEYQELSGTFLLYR